MFSKNELTTEIQGMQLSNPKKLEVPVVFFIFRRPETTKKVFEAIREARPDELFVIADGPSFANDAEKELTNRTREVVSQVDWPCKVHRIYAQENMGLRERIFTGLDEVFSKVPSAIILEDDCLPTPYFFDFCTLLLSTYSDEKRVGVVSGFNFGPYESEKEDFFFSLSPSIWGWATWARTWKAFRLSPQVEKWSQEEIEDLRPSFASRFQRSEFLWFMRIAHTLNTWDISFFVWLRQSRILSAIPRQNLVTNIGFGDGATHTKFESFDLQVDTGLMSEPVKFPSSISENKKIERNLWRRRRFRWVTFPLLHPIKFSTLVLGYLRRQLTFPITVQHKD